MNARGSTACGGPPTRQGAARIEGTARAGSHRPRKLRLRLYGSSIDPGGGGGARPRQPKRDRRRRRRHHHHRPTQGRGQHRPQP
eukprot:15461475-Alexandrium_andersonii.AAC.1